MFFSIDCVKPFIGPYLSTAQGRAQLLTAFVEPARTTLREAANDPTGGYVASTEVRIIEAVLSRCDGSEVYDTVGVQSVIGDLKGLMARHGSSPPESEASVTAQFEDLIQFIRTYTDGPIWNDATVTDDDGA